ncbi:nucleotidyl transferase AbiEii/AbiGii toxin family protein [Paenarthrobacter sp. 2TAF44]|uniref:nucleotidyl transferase AbiEii/AbiGii toxin family protein n=1 Tax=Paenarthrobacter sp. 2TAF44 TaxID=3233018 RepID=UPI003F9A0ABC
MSSSEIYRQLQAVARKRGRPSEEIFVLYALERFLARLSDTRHAGDFCLKGGVLLSAHALRRPTRDIDMQALDFQLDVTRITEVVKNGFRRRRRRRPGFQHRRSDDRADSGRG